MFWFGVVMFSMVPDAKGHLYFQKMFVDNISYEGPTIFLPSHFNIHVIILPVLFCVCQNSIHCFIIELQYNYVLTL